ncbi:unnamed protein product [Orchesella dallaii]|uniref:Uncharacterized protein n=1 Tax=Orchesella dallaii TaxID=48710 RepID=A0ABP1RJU1_9HEXA
MLRFATNLELRYRQPNRMEFVDKMLVAAIIAFPIISWIFYGGFLLLQQDPFYFSLNDIFAVETESKLALVLRMILMFAEFEFSRSGTLFLSIILVAASRWQKIVNVLLQNRRIRNIQRIESYIKLQILHIEMSPLLNDAATTAISSLFWGLVFLICFILNGPGTSPLGIYILVASFGVVGIFITIYGFNLLASLLESVVEIVNMCKKDADYEVLRGAVGIQGRKAAKVTQLQAKGLQAIKIQYRPFHNINRNFVANYDQHRQPTSPKMDDIVVIRNTTLSNKDKQIVKELSPFYSSTPGRFGKKTTTTSLLRLPSKMGQLGALYTQTCCGFITPVMMHQQIPQQPLLHLTSTTKTST